MCKDEGYIKFSLELIKTALPIDVSLYEINKVREKLYNLGLIGAYSNGIGYGNISIRYGSTIKNQFVITGSATGNKDILYSKDYCVVTDFDIFKNKVVCEGAIKASSESMTHGAIYQVDANVVAVIHIHSRKLFDFMLKGNHPQTPKSAKFGTPDLAIAIAKLVKNSKKSSGIFVTAGHDEGIIAYGTTIQEALNLIVQQINF